MLQEICHYRRRRANCGPVRAFKRQLLEGGVDRPGQNAGWDRDKALYIAFFLLFDDTYSVYIFSIAYFYGYTRNHFGCLGCILQPKLNGKSVRLFQDQADAALATVSRCGRIRMPLGTTTWEGDASRPVSPDTGPKRQDKCCGCGGAGLRFPASLHLQHLDCATQQRGRLLFGGRYADKFGQDQPCHQARWRRS